MVKYHFLGDLTAAINNAKLYNYNNKNIENIY